MTQVCKISKRVKKESHKIMFKLRGNPQVSCMCLKYIIGKPKKPNAGKRRIAVCTLHRRFNKLKLLVRITSYAVFPEIKSTLLVRGGRAPDVPGLKYTAIRGVYEFPPHETRKKRKSYYGNKTPIEKITRIPRYYRRIGITTPAGIVGVRIKSKKTRVIKE